MFGSCLDTFLYSGRKVFPNILQVINNESVTHEEFKVYIIIRTYLDLCTYLLLLSYILVIFDHFHFSC